MNAKQESSADPYQLAREIINAANERGISFAEMLHERFPVGRGGVGHARARLHRETLARISEWLEPGEYPEPTYGGACG
jgi:hypothetical protein